jgi:hypothetical protein
MNKALKRIKKRILNPDLILMLGASLCAIAGVITLDNMTPYADAPELDGYSAKFFWAGIGFIVLYIIVIRLIEWYHAKKAGGY